MLSNWNSNHLRSGLSGLNKHQTILFYPSGKERYVSFFPSEKERRKDNNRKPEILLIFQLDLY